MRKHAMVLAVVSLALAGLLKVSHAAGAIVGRLVPVQMGPMGEGMGSGMMRPGSGGGAGRGPAAQALRTYIRDHRLECFTCHMIHRSAVGPAFVDIADRYAGRPGAKEELTGAIAHGTSGKWPAFPTAMPGNLASPAQARALAALILRLHGSP